MAIYHRDHFDCVYCRLVFPPATGRGDLTLDHVIPRSQGGSNDAANLVTCCWACNSSRQDRDLTAGEKRRAARAVARSLDMDAGRRLAAGQGARAQLEIAA